MRYRIIEKLASATVIAIAIVLLFSCMSRVFTRVGNLKDSLNDRKELLKQLD